MRIEIYDDYSQSWFWELRDEWINNNVMSFSYFLKVEYGLTLTYINGLMDGRRLYGVIDGDEKVLFELMMTM